MRTWLDDLPDSTTVRRGFMWLWEANACHRGMEHQMPHLRLTRRGAEKYAAKILKQIRKESEELRAHAS